MALDISIYFEICLLCLLLLLPSLLLVLAASPQPPLLFNLHLHVLSRRTVGGMCDIESGGSVAVDETNGGFVLSATTVAHELGHNFGMEHDGDDNACSTG